MKTLIKNVTILTMNEQLDMYQQGEMLIEDDTIIEIGKTCSGTYDQCIDGHQGILLPGMINTHTHLGMIPFRGLGDDCPDRLRRFLFPLESKCMTPELVYHSSRYAMAEMLLSGITTFMDMYYFENEVAKAADEMKMRAFVGETIVDFPSCDSDQAYGGLDYCQWFIPKWKNHPLITPFVAPHATNTNDLKHLQLASQLAQKYDVPFSLHASELDYEMDYFQKEYQMTPTEFLNHYHLLNKNVVLAHCIHINDHDIDLIKENGASVAHCLVSNLKAGKGVMPLKQLLEKDVFVGLGTDGPSSGNTLELFSMMKMIACVHKTVNHDRNAFPCQDIVSLATLQGAKALHIDHLVGSLEIGKRADFIIVDTDSVSMYPLYDPYSALVYSANAGLVNTVFVNGECLVKDKTLQKVSLEELKQNLQQDSSTFSKQALEYVKGL
ncbi:amidohydrolase [Allocoprobacillus halotolerans]|uniref:Amidohydrolase n=1 Tax=Allocoprobacillus halotolerans TaxID=2944914 RepID=A0ABY5I4B8_9FIRM|nr:amidohydrolase [Allocoprobacillus halotolerans]UTY39031.1 amidohydrolase [Allocoprobacillus halotolerans]